MSGHLIRGTYPPDWPQIAKAIKEAASWRCERCGHPNDPPWKVTGTGGPAPCDDRCTHPTDGKQRVLTVDHLDGDKSNISLWNLAALCQVCHLQVQGRVRMEQVYAFDHSLWMRPHVEGMLAATAAGEWPRKETH